MLPSNAVFVMKRSVVLTHLPGRTSQVPIYSKEKELLFSVSQVLSPQPARQPIYRVMRSDTVKALYIHQIKYTFPVYYLIPILCLYLADMKALGVDDVYCLSVNDAFVMRQWGIHQGLEKEDVDASSPLNPGNFKKVKMLPDGACQFTRGMGASCTWEKERGERTSVYIFAYSHIYSLSSFLNY